MCLKLDLQVRAGQGIVAIEGGKIPETRDKPATNRFLFGV
jgi:hypothetical protein